MDASEPNVRDCTDMEYRKLLCGPTKYGSSDEYFNAYSIVNAEAIYDGQRAYEFSPENKRVFLLTRNGFASEQRYSTATWSGDIGTRWEDMKAQITAGLNFSISGVPYWSQDIGGFSVEKRYQEAQNEFDKTGVENADLKDWRELNVRWHQMGMFAPMYRVHGQFPFREPWNIAPEGTETYKAITACMDMRYRLMEIPPHALHLLSCCRRSLQGLHNDAPYGDGFRQGQERAQHSISVHVRSFNHG